MALRRSDRLMELPSQSRRVLAAALELGVFTVPQLAMQCGVDHDAVERTLEQDASSTIARTGERTIPGVLPATDVWEVVAPDELREHVHATSSVEPRPAPANPPLALDETDRLIAAAEDRMVIALGARASEDSHALVREALAFLDDADLAPDSRPPSASADSPLVAEHNVPPAVGRAWIVEALGAYLLSDETEGLHGPHWRAAFRAIAAIDQPAHAALQKRLLVHLVRTADERSQREIYGVPRAELAELFAVALASPETIGELLEPENDVLRTALGRLLNELGRGHSAAHPSIVARLCDVGGRSFRAGSFPPASAVELAVAGLRELARHQDPQIARPAQDALLQIGRPRDADFWSSLQHAPCPAPPEVIFLGLSTFDLDAAFDFVREVVASDRRAVAPARAALVEALPALERIAPYAVQDSFARFLAALTQEHRSYFIATPKLAGLSWPPPPFERPLAQRFFWALEQWLAFVDGAHVDAGVREQREVLGQEVRSLAEQTFLTLTAGEQRHARAVLRSRIGNPDAAPVCVSVLVGVGREAEVAKALRERRSYDDPDAVAAWYLGVRTELSPEQRTTLVEAIYDARGRDQRFLSRLAARADAETSDLKLAEIFDNPAFDPETRFVSETAMYTSHGTQIKRLRARADNTQRW